MGGIDPKTVLLMTGTLGGVMALVLYLLRRSYLPAVMGIGFWALSLAMTFVAGTLFSTTGTLPVPVSTTLPSMMLYLSPYVSLLGTQRFFGATSKHLPWALLIAPAALASMWFTYGDPDYGARLQLSSSVLFILCAAHVRLMWRHGRHTLAGRIALGVLACSGAVQALRFVSTLIYPAGLNAMDASPQNVAYLVTFSFTIVLISISHVLLVNDRLRGELEHAATHDSLTDAYTRRYMGEALQRELVRCQRHGRVMSLMLMDIDHFKAVNDVSGHLAGDRVLIEFVARTNALLRADDMLGRYGGEEFVVLLPETPLDVAQLVAERVRAAMAGQPGPTVSIGVTTSLGAGDSVDALLARADAAMYRAKALGRNRVESV